MERQEFSDQFDVLYNSITSNQAPGLDTYEKSVFLTKAQNEILLSYFDPRGNKVLEGFDDSERRQIDFSNITYTKEFSANKPEYKTDFEVARFDPRENSKSVHWDNKDDILLIVNERAAVKRGKEPEEGQPDTRKWVYLTVVPIQYRDYDRLMSKPYKRPLNYQAWRLINNTTSDKAFDLIVGPADELQEYKVRYIKKPYPIILDDLDKLTIDGKSYDEVSKFDACELDPILHPEILQRAVELANLAYKVTNEQLVASLSNTSMTQVGVPPQANRQ